MKITLTVSSTNLTQKQLNAIMKIIADEKVKAWARIRKEEEPGDAADGQYLN
jgi:hypothetical protein